MDFKTVDEVRNFAWDKERAAMAAARAAAIEYFKKYEGKMFSDVGIINAYSKSAVRWGDYWYVEVESGNNHVYCIISASENDPKFKSMQKEFPVQTKVTISGKAAEWNQDNTLRLEDFCQIKR